MEEELVDVYDENKNITGKIIKRTDINLLKENEYIITVHCFIINSHNQILLTQRSLNKKSAGKWEDTHGGLQSGESSVFGIQRELKEEIGIDIQINELKFIKTLRKKNKFRDIYIIKKDIPLDDFKCNAEEVMNCKYVTLEEFKTMIENNQCTFKSFEDTIFYDSDIKKLLI